MLYNRSIFDILEVKGEGLKAKTTVVLNVQGFVDKESAPVNISKRAVTKAFELLDFAGAQVSECPESILVRALDKTVPGLTGHIFLNREEDDKEPVRSFMTVLQEIHEEMNEVESTSNPLNYLASYLCSFTTPANISQALMNLADRITSMSQEDKTFLANTLKTRATKNGVDAEGYIRSRAPKGSGKKAEVKAEATEA